MRHGAQMCASCAPRSRTVAPSDRGGAGIGAGLDPIGQDHRVRRAVQRAATPSITSVPVPVPSMTRRPWRSGRARKVRDLRLARGVGDGGLPVRKSWPPSAGSRWRRPRRRAARSWRRFRPCPARSRDVAGSPARCGRPSAPGPSGGGPPAGSRSRSRRAATPAPPAARQQRGRAPGWRRASCGRCRTAPRLR